MVVPEVSLSHMQGLAWVGDTQFYLLTKICAGFHSHSGGGLSLHFIMGVDEALGSANPIVRNAVPYFNLHFCSHYLCDGLSFVSCNVQIPF